jgi:hypothetical protein
MKLERGGYFSAITNGGLLDEKPVKALLTELREHLTLEDVPLKLLRQSSTQGKITEKLSRLCLHVATESTSWGGLVVGFPGSVRQLTTEIVSTPYLREILYPALDLHQRINRHYEKRLPCLYWLGVRFPDVFLMEFRLLAQVIPHVVVLTSDLLRAKSLEPPELPAEVDRERWSQAWLCREMDSQDGLRVPVQGGDIRLGYLAHEVHTGEGTTRPERLDILGYDKADHSLVAFEIKGPGSKRVDLENLFLQGLAHREWLELNKMVVKLVFDGPRGRHVNTRKRGRLVLGFFSDEVPELFWKLRRQAMKDRYLEIDFVHFARSGGRGEELVLTRMDEMDS